MGSLNKEFVIFIYLFLKKRSQSQQNILAKLFLTNLLLQL